MVMMLVLVMVVTWMVGMWGGEVLRKSSINSIFYLHKRVRTFLFSIFSIDEVTSWEFSECLQYVTFPIKRYTTWCQSQCGIPRAGLIERRRHWIPFPPSYPHTPTISPKSLDVIVWYRLRINNCRYAFSIREILWNSPSRLISQ